VDGDLRENLTQKLFDENASLIHAYRMCPKCHLLPDSDDESSSSSSSDD
jgi:hypothetical protein